MTNNYDLIIIGAGSGGLMAAELATQFGVKTALVEKARIGGDCTWTGCIPSKALLKAARVAHQTRTAGRYGISTSASTIDMVQVKDYVQQTIAEIYRYETPDVLAAKGVDVVSGPARFIDPHTIQVGEQKLTARKFIIATGAQPVIPSISGLEDVAFVTYQQIFENDRLPGRLMVIGAGPVGVELAQAYQRLDDIAA